MTSKDPAAADLERSSERWLAWLAGETARRRHPPGSAPDALWDVLEEWFASDDFAGSVEFVNRLAPVAEEMNHHPDLEISWNKVTVSITTHSEGGLTENDFELAGRISRLA